MKIWTKPTLINLSSNSINSGGAGPAQYEHYINLGSYGTQTGNGGGPWPCATTGGSWVTTSWYNTTAGTGVACNSIAACDQAGAGSAPGTNLSATANCS